MADLDRAIAAAREAVQELDGFKHPELADAYLAHCVGTLRDLLAALDAAQAPPAELAVPADAVWLMPNATDKPADGRLMHYAWGRSKLTTGQMAEAYQCIVSAAQACGQVCTPPAAPAVPADNVTPMRQPRADLARLVESINAAVYANGDGLSVTEAIGALELAKLELLKEQEQ